MLFEDTVYLYTSSHNLVKYRTSISGITKKNPTVMKKEPPTAAILLQVCCCAWYYCHNARQRKVADQTDRLTWESKI